jgi:hypothetical protein
MNDENCFTNTRPEPVVNSIILCQSNSLQYVVGNGTKVTKIVKALHNTEIGVADHYDVYIGDKLISSVYTWEEIIYE